MTGTETAPGSQDDGDSGYPDGEAGIDIHIDGPTPRHTGDEGWIAGSYIDPTNESQWAARYERRAPPTRRKLSEEGFARPSCCDALYD